LQYGRAEPAADAEREFHIVAVLGRRPAQALLAATMAAMMPPEQVPASAVRSLPVIRVVASMASRTA
jgi:hypothetical protein